LTFAVLHQQDYHSFWLFVYFVIKSRSSAILLLESDWEIDKGTTFCLVFVSKLDPPEVAALFPPTLVAMSDEEHRKLQQLTLKLQQLSCGKQVHAVRSDRRRDLRLMSSGSVDSLPADTCNNSSTSKPIKVAVTRCSSAGKLNHHQVANRLADSNNNHSQSPIKLPASLPSTFFRDNFRLSSAQHPVQHKLPVKPNGQLPPLVLLSPQNGEKLSPSNGSDCVDGHQPTVTSDDQIDPTEQISSSSPVEEDKQLKADHGEPFKSRFSVAAIDKSNGFVDSTQVTTKTTHTSRLTSVDVQLPKLVTGGSGRTGGEHVLEQLPETPDEDLYSEDSEPITVIACQAPQRELEEAEEDDCDDDNDLDDDDSNDEGTRGPLIRSTSLKTTNTEPITPGRKKMVRFADALGTCTSRYL
jgi:hypothetical protein